MDRSLHLTTCLEVIGWIFIYSFVGTAPGLKQDAGGAHFSRF